MYNLPDREVKLSLRNYPTIRSFNLKIELKTSFTMTLYNTGEIFSHRKSGTCLEFAPRYVPNNVEPRKFTHKISSTIVVDHD